MDLFGNKARVEIERKYLVVGEGWRGLGESVAVRQGFLSVGAGSTVRVRRVLDRGYIAVKGPSRGATRAEFEYEIPARDADAMLAGLCEGTVIEKVRHRIPVGDLVWEVDEFGGKNRGLILAEVEVESEDQTISPPSWIGEEVTRDPRYFNAYLARRPFTTW